MFLVPTNPDMWHNGIRVNSIDMVVLTRRYNQRSGTTGGWNREVKRARGGVVWGWVTDREVWPRLEFDRRLNVISVKNGQSERVTRQTIRKKKLEKKLKQKFWKKIDPKIEFWKNGQRGPLVPVCPFFQNSILGSIFFQNFCFNFFF